MKLLQSDVIRCLELLLRHGTMNRAYTATCLSIARLWRFTLCSLIDFSLKFQSFSIIEFAKNALPTLRPKSNPWLKTSCSRSKDGTNSKLCIVGYPIIPVILAATIYYVDHCESSRIFSGYGHMIIPIIIIHYRKFTIPNTHISYCEGHRLITLPTDLPKKCLAD